MIILVIAVAAIIASIVFGLAIFYPKSAYIAVQTETKNVTPENWYLSVFHMNGDAAYLNHSTGLDEMVPGMPVDFQFTTPYGATLVALPDQDDGPEMWKPGDTLFVYNNSGILAVTKNEGAARNGTGLPVGVWRFDVVDRTDNVLVYTRNTGIGVPDPTPTPPTQPVTTTPTTIIPNTTVTTSPVTTVTTTATTTVTTSPTTTATTSPVTTVTTTPTTTVTTVPTTPVPDCGTISGTKWNDLDNNGIRDPGEPGLSGWIMLCYYKEKSTFVLVATTTTGINGEYVFTGRQYSKAAEQYYIQEIGKPGWTATSPASGISDIFILNPDPTKCYKTGVNFGNHYTG